MMYNIEILVSKHALFQIKIFPLATTHEIMTTGKRCYSTNMILVPYSYKSWLISVLLPESQMQASNPGNHMHSYSL